MPDGSILDAVVNNPTTALLPSTTNDILSVPALAVMPQETAIWTVSSSVLTPEIWRILSIIEDSKGIYSVSALEHNASKFSAIENNTILTTPTVSLIQLIPDAVTNLAVVGARYVISPGIQGTKMTLSWDASPTATKYIVSYTENQGNPIEVTTTSTTVDILNAVAGATYSVTVTAYNSLGVASV
jgi:predicted phage tail protein